MTIITDKKLYIHKDFEDEINKIKGKPIDQELINYKHWKQDRQFSKVYRLPIEYCRFRVDNGRIKTETITHATRTKPLDQFSPEDQRIISNFLKESDQTKNEDLMKSLKREGQKKPAIITADGFLINGNRRRWALEQLFKDTSDRNFSFIKVVILPGTDEPDAPTLVDIALLENRLQMAKDGWSEYKVMNKVLTFKANCDNGIELAELLRDDNDFHDLPKKEFNKKVEQWREDNFGTLELMDKYLEINGIKGDYKRAEKRWESFKELNDKVISKFRTKNFLSNLGYNMEEQGEIKLACFNLMKLKDPTEAKFKRHTDLVREIKKWMKHKKEFLKLADIGEVDGDFKTLDDRDRLWQKKKGQEVVNIIKSLNRLTEKKESQEGPIKRLREALQKFETKHLDEDQINRLIQDDDLEEALKLCNSIQTAARDLHSQLFNARKKHPKNLKKGTHSFEDFKELNKIN